MPRVVKEIPNRGRGLDRELGDVSSTRKRRTPATPYQGGKRGCRHENVRESRFHVRQGWFYCPDCGSFMQNGEVNADNGSKDENS